MKSSWFLVIAGCILAVSWSGGLQAAEPSQGVAAARVRAAIQTMRASGKSDAEILKAVEGMLDRVAVASGAPNAPRRPAGPPPEAAQIRKRIQAAIQKMRAEGKSPEEIQAAVAQMKQRAMALLQKRAQPAKRPEITPCPKAASCPEAKTCPKAMTSKAKTSKAKPQKPKKDKAPKKEKKAKPEKKEPKKERREKKTDA